MRGYLRIVSFEAIPQIIPSETGRMIPEDGWYQISDDTDLKRDIR